MPILAPTLMGGLGDRTQLRKGLAVCQLVLNESTEVVSQISLGANWLYFRGDSKSAVFH